MSICSSDSPSCACVDFRFIYYFLRLKKWVSLPSQRDSRLFSSTRLVSWWVKEETNQQVNVPEGIRGSSVLLLFLASANC